MLSIRQYRNGVLWFLFLHGLIGCTHAPRGLDLVHCRALCVG